MFLIGGEWDFVVVYKIYCEKWLENMLSDDVLFYLVVNYIRKKDFIKKWFKLVFVGFNKLNILMKIMVFKVNLSNEWFINYSVCKYMI